MAKKREDYNEYMRKYMLKRYHERRAWAIDSLGGKCVRCGTMNNLQMDHIDPTKKSMNLSKAWSVAFDKFVKELDKCQLLCYECHKQKSREDGSTNHPNRPRGERITNSKLTSKQVLEIRKLHATGNYTYREIASMYPVSSSNVRQIVQRMTWKHI